VVHVDAETLKHSHAGLVAIIENARSEPLDIGRKTRTIPPAIRRALNARDKGCRFPCCTFKRYVDGHHVRHWALDYDLAVGCLMERTKRAKNTPAETFSDSHRVRHVDV
jgi:hypothetical protein